MSRNTNTRYKFAPVNSNSGAFFFPTDEGCYFTIEIQEGGYKLWKSDKLSGDDKVLELSFDVKCDDCNPIYDDAVCNTIIYIFSSNMASKGDLLVFYHIWEQQPAQSQLYENWYEDLEKALPDFEAFDFQAKEMGVDDPYITSLFIHREHPDKALIISEFEKAVGNE